MNISRKIRKACGEDPVLAAISEAAGQCGSELHLVGGYLRDLLCGKPTRDVDFLLRGNPDRFLKSIARRGKGRVMTFRKEGITNHRIRIGERFCDFVELAPGTEVRRELARRDFTVNSLAWNLHAEELLDPFHGLDDLRAKRLRAIGPKTFAVDPLRILRGIRIAAELKRFTIAPATRRQMTAARDRLGSIPVERIREEIDRILLSGQAEPGLRRMREIGVLFPLFPELEPMETTMQAQRQSVLDHTLRVVGLAERWPRLGRTFFLEEQPEPEEILVLLYAALFHDLGKPAAHKKDPDGSIHFYGHERISRTLTAGISRRMRFPGKRAARIERLALHHLRAGWLTEGRPGDRALRRVIRDLEDDLPLLLLLSVADRKGSAPRGRAEDDRHRRICRSLYRMYRDSGSSILKPPRLVDGHDVMKNLKIGPGRAVGNVLERIRELQEEGSISTRAEALREVKKGIRRTAGE